ncbi:MAG: molybdopterin-dependent oxidoreductase [Proteobacteria bacterium]|nr:molybdopterin-dependent oxidoreductase [Pseudomonadota bacterium]
MGIAIFESHGSIGGCCATVSVSKRGDLAVEKVDMFVNSGYILNPRNAREQVESAVAFELGAAMVGGLDIREGRIQSTNFDSYGVMRIDNYPEISTSFELSEDGWWGGIGEPGGPPMPPAVANAIYYATNKRIRQTPFTKAEL